MHLYFLFTVALAATPLISCTSTDSSVVERERLHLDEHRNVGSKPDNNAHSHRRLRRWGLRARGIGKMRIPLYVGMLPPNMTLTIDKIIETKPSGVDLWEEGVPKLPFTITSAQAETNRNKGWRGVRIGDFVSSMSGFGLGKNAGGVFDIRYTIAGRPDEAAGTGVQNIQGWLTISTSDWGILGRPDTTNFQWKVGESSVETYVADTPDLTYLDDTVITVVYVPESKEYMVGVTNQADTIVKFMQTAVKGILTLHEVAVDGVIDLAGGHVAAVAAGLGMKAVSWAAEEISSGDK